MTTATSTRADPGQRAVNFFAKRLHHTKAPWAGRPFVPSAWQAKWLREVFGTLNPDGRRKYRVTYLEVPKKNGKTTLTGGCLLKCLFDEDEEGGEVYSAAAKREQAGIMYSIMASMVRRSPRLMNFKGKPTRLYDRDKRIYVPATESFYQALSADANLEDGINPSAAACDELHRLRSRDMLDILEEGMAARSEPLLFILTTAGGERSGPAWDTHEYAEKIIRGVATDPAFHATIYAAPTDAEPGSEKVWYACNPALREGILDIENVRGNYAKAKEVPAKMRQFRRLRLNQWVSGDEAWLDPAEWDACGRLAGPSVIEERNLGRKCWIGVDLSSTSDVTAECLVFDHEEDEGYDVLPRMWIPQAGLEAQGVMRTDFELWGKAKFIEVTPGDRIEYLRVAKHIVDDLERFDVQEIGFDPWHAVHITELVEQIAGERGVHLPPMTKVSQYASVMNAPCKLFETLISRRLIEHGGHPVLRWMSGNVILSVNPYDAVRPSKAKSRSKIDGITATLIALERAMHPAAPAAEAFYLS